MSWAPPFSLNLTNIEPNIIYCVDITCGRSHLISECDVMETSYTNDVLHSGYIYEYTVTPRSNLQGAANDTSQSVTGVSSSLVTNKNPCMKNGMLLEALVIGIIFGILNLICRELYGVETIINGTHS